MSARMQRTLKRAAEFSGVGLHTGEKGHVVLKPAPAGSGIQFVRTDLPGRPAVDVRPENAHFDPRAGRRTILQKNGVQIHTMEHVLAAIAGLGIDNLTVETSTMEIPEFQDGSAAPIARLLCETGYEAQDRPRQHIKVTKPVHWQEDDIALSAEPYVGFRITFTIDYDHPLPGVPAGLRFRASRRRSGLPCAR